MEQAKQIGMFWASDYLFFVKAQLTEIVRSFKISIKPKVSNGVGVTKVEEGIQLASIPPEDLPDNSLINISLPTQDILFRSFVVPWVSANEIKSLVEFEVLKYIPFRLEDLVYSFRSTVCNKDNLRSLRIVFVAIKKTVLNRYLTAVKEAGKEPNYVEPGAVALIRALLVKDVISMEQTVAIVEKDNKDGKIIITTQGDPLFVREFQLRPAYDVEEQDNDQWSAHLIDEVNISLDYFSRQEDMPNVEQIIFLSKSSPDVVIKKLEGKLPLPVHVVCLQEIFHNDEINLIGFLKAYGSAVAGQKLPVYFELSGEKKRQHTKPSLAADGLDYKEIIKTVVICVISIILTFIVTNNLIKRHKYKVEELKKELGEYQSISIEKVRLKNSRLKNRLNVLKNIRLKSDIHFFLEIIPTLLPSGTWIKDIDITYLDTEGKNKSYKSDSEKKNIISISMSGYAYLDETKEQFRQVNELLKRLKGAKKFSDFFDNINLETNVTKLSNYTVTVFKIQCR